MSDQNFPSGLPRIDEKRSLSQKISEKFSSLLNRSKTSEVSDHLSSERGTSTGFTSKISAGVRGLKSDPAALSAWLTERVQSRGLGFYGRLICVVLCAFFLADILALLSSKYIPEPPVLRSSAFGSNNRTRTKSVDFYQSIIARNLFNSKGLIPGEAAPKEDPGGTPIKTNLPLTLIGTLVLSDELRSIATLEDKSNGSLVLPLRIEDEIPTKIRILQIEPRKVTFLNLEANRREFVELPEDPATSNARIELAAPKSGQGISKLSETQYSLSKSELDKTLSDINNVVTQARCVPNFEGGVAAGFKCFQIVPGSIYDKLGMKNGDVIVGVNGEPLNDISKAFEFFGKLREMKDLELQLKRDGRIQNYSYRIN